MNHHSKFFSLLTALAALMVLAATPVRSQITVKLGGGLGLFVPAGDFGGSTIDYYHGTGYGLGSGINLQAKAKLGFSALNLVGEIDYASVSNNGSSEPGQGMVDLSQKILTFKVGPEFHLSLPVAPVSPYIGANLSVNRFSGETTFQGVSKLPSATYTIQDASRLGIGFTAGTEVTISPFVSLDFNISYNLMNVSGSEWQDVNPATNQRLDSYLALNDANDPLYASGDDKHFNTTSRRIHSILFTASVLFGL